MLRFLDAHFEEVLGAILLAVMVSIAFINVIVRYCTSFSFAWTEEMTVNFFVWVTLLGIARSYRDDSHLAMAIFYNTLPLPLKKACNILSSVLCLVFFGALFYTGSVEVMDEYELEAISESLGIPVWWYTIATPAFSLLIIYRMLQNFFHNWRTGGF